jgi:putative flavoprotein involved in K+ transport
VRVHPRVVDAAGSELTFEDGERLSVAGVVWATGFRVDHSWVDLPVFDEGGRAQHRRGVTSARGLYFLGLQWQYTRGSALLGWVKDDAAHIAGQIAAHQRTKPARVTA